MSEIPATTVNVISLESCGPSKVRILMEMIVDVHRLAEVGGEMLHAAIEGMNAEKKEL